jgi:hypothetical protein
MLSRQALAVGLRRFFGLLVVGHLHVHRRAEESGWAMKLEREITVFWRHAAFSEGQNQIPTAAAAAAATVVKSCHDEARIEANE